MTRISKKVLALVLAFACAFTMFAGAAFTDSADIKVDTEVVDTLVSLGIVRALKMALSAERYCNPCADGKDDLRSAYRQL